MWMKRPTFELIFSDCHDSWSFRSIVLMRRDSVRRERDLPSNNSNAVIIVVLTPIQLLLLLPKVVGPAKSLLLISFLFCYAHWILFLFFLVSPTFLVSALICFDSVIRSFDSDSPTLRYFCKMTVLYHSRQRMRLQCSTNNYKVLDSLTDRRRREKTSEPWKKSLTPGY